MRRYLERWGGIWSDGEEYGVISRARERWEGMWGDEVVSGAMGRYVG